MISEKNWMAQRLRPHLGHEIECVCCGKQGDPDDICIECVDCFEVLVSAEDFNDEPDTDVSDEVTEYCGNCGNEVTLRWNVDTDGYKAFCPVCGNRLMLCDACMHRENGELHDDCNYCTDTDTCRFNSGDSSEEKSTPEEQNTEALAAQSEKDDTVNMLLSTLDELDKGDAGTDEVLDAMANVLGDASMPTTAIFRAVIAKIAAHSDAKPSAGPDGQPFTTTERMEQIANAAMDYFLKEYSEGWLDDEGLYLSLSDDLEMTDAEISATGIFNEESIKELKKTEVKE